MLVIQEMHKYVIRHEDEIIGPFASWEEAQAWLDSLSGPHSGQCVDQSYIERIEDPIKTKALWSGWDKEVENEAKQIEASVTLASEHSDG